MTDYVLQACLYTSLPWLEEVSTRLSRDIPTDISMAEVSELLETNRVISTGPHAKHLQVIRFLDLEKTGQRSHLMWGPSMAPVLNCGSSLTIPLCSG